MENSYQDREIDHFMEEFDKRMTHQDGMLSEIRIQALKTNGRVNKHDWYFTALWWALGLVGALILYTAPSVISFVAHINELDAKVSALVEDYQMNEIK